MMTTSEAEVIIAMVTKGLEVIVRVPKYSVGYTREGWTNAP